MPYQLLTNVANFDTLLEEIRDFADATGDWTLHQDMAAADEDALSPNEAAGRQLVLSSDDCLAAFRSTTTGPGADRLFLFDGVPPYDYSSGFIDTLGGYSGNQVSPAELGSASEPACRHLQQKTGPFPTAHLFSDDPSTYIHAAIEIAAGRFRHLLFGNLLKKGTWVGGAYYACTYWYPFGTPYTDSPGNPFSCVPFDNGNIGASREWSVHYEHGADQWIAPGEQVFNTVQRRKAFSSFRGGFGRMFKNIPVSPWSGFVPLAPVIVMASRQTDTPDTVRIVGEVPDFRMVNMTNFAPGDTLPIGGDEYLVFPLVAKNGGAGQDNSGVAGCAYLKRP